MKIYLILVKNKKRSYDIINFLFIKSLILQKNKLNCLEKIYC